MDGRRMHARTRNSIRLEENHSREIASNLTYSIDWDAAPAAAAAVIKVNITFFPIYVRVTYVCTLRNIGGICSSDMSS